MVSLLLSTDSYSEVNVLKFNTKLKFRSLHSEYSGVEVKSVKIEANFLAVSFLLVRLMWKSVVVIVVNKVVLLLFAGVQRNSTSCCSCRVWRTVTANCCFRRVSSTSSRSRAPQDQGCPGEAEAGDPSRNLPPTLATRTASPAIPVSAATRPLAGRATRRSHPGPPRYQAASRCYSNNRKTLNRISTNCACSQWWMGALEEEGAAGAAQEEGAACLISSTA